MAVDRFLDLFAHRSSCIAYYYRMDTCMSLQ